MISSSPIWADPGRRVLGTVPLKQPPLDNGEQGSGQMERYSTFAGSISGSDLFVDVFCVEASVRELPR